MNNEALKVVPHPKLKRDYKGRIVRATRDLTNGWGTIPAGSVGTISNQSPKGSSIDFPPCECCGLRAHISRVDVSGIEFVEQQSKATPDTEMNEEVLAAENRLSTQLNYGGIERDSVSGKLEMNYRPGDLPDEIGQMRRLARAFEALADSLEDKGIECAQRLPTQDDADDNGDVEWLRSGVWMRGRVSTGVPVDATRWRCLGVRV